MEALIAALAVALSVSFLCSLTEACVLSLGATDIAEIHKKNPRVAERWQRLRNEIDRPIAVILILNTLAHTMGATIAGARFADLTDNRWVGLFSAVLAFVVIQWTEILPKTLGVRYRRRLALWLAAPLEWTVTSFRSFIWIIHFLNRPFERRMPGHRPTTVEEIESLAQYAEIQRRIEPEQGRIISGALRLPSLTADRLMIPVAEMATLSTGMTLSQALDAAHQNPHTRFPLAEEGDADRIVGYVNFKDIVASLRTNPSDPTLRGIARPILTVPPGESASNLLRSFVSGHHHMAVVRDGGKTLGLITLEDVIEELVGELQDEYDLLPRYCYNMPGGTWEIGGGAPSLEVAQKLQVSLSNTGASMSEWFLRHLGRPPRPNDQVCEAGYRFVVRRIRRGKVFELKASRA